MTGVHQVVRYWRIRADEEVMLYLLTSFILGIPRTGFLKQSLRSLTGQNGIGQNGTDEMVRTKW